MGEFSTTFHSHIVGYSYSSERSVPEWITNRLIFGRLHKRQVALCDRPVDEYADVVQHPWVLNYVGSFQFPIWNFSGM